MIERIFEIDLEHCLNGGGELKTIGAGLEGTSARHRQHKLATADAIVLATAQRHGAELLTCDSHFKGLPGVVLFAKVQ